MYIKLFFFISYNYFFSLDFKQIFRKKFVLHSKTAKYKTIILKLKRHQDKV